MSRNTKKPTEAQDESAPPPKPLVTISSIDVLTEMCRKPVAAKFEFGGKVIQIELRHLTPAEEALLTEIVEAVIPPMVKGQKPEDMYPDISNPDYLRKRRAAELEARALAIYWCVPSFSAGHEVKLTDRAKITEYVQSKVNEQILAVLWAAIRQGGVNEADLVNFTSPGPSAQS